MRARAAAAGQDGERLGVLQAAGQLVHVRLGGRQARQARRRPVRVRRRRGQQAHVARQHQHGHALLAHGGIQRAVQHFGHLRGVGHQLRKHAAFTKQLLRMRFLKVAQPDFG